MIIIFTIHIVVIATATSKKSIEDDWNWLQTYILNTLGKAVNKKSHIVFLKKQFFFLIFSPSKNVPSIIEKVKN